MDYIKPEDVDRLARIEYLANVWHGKYSPENIPYTHKPVERIYGKKYEVIYRIKDDKNGDTSLLERSKILNELYSKAYGLELYHDSEVINNISNELDDAITHNSIDRFENTCHNINAQDFVLIYHNTTKMDSLTAPSFLQHFLASAKEKEVLFELLISCNTSGTSVFEKILNNEDLMVFIKDAFSAEQYLELLEQKVDTGTRLFEHAACSRGGLEFVLTSLGSDELRLKALSMMVHFPYYENSMFYKLSASYLGNNYSSNDTQVITDTFQDKSLVLYLFAKAFLEQHKKSGTIIDGFEKTLELLLPDLIEGNIISCFLTPQDAKLIANLEGKGGRMEPEEVKSSFKTIKRYQGDVWGIDSAISRAKTIDKLYSCSPCVKRTDDKHLKQERVSKLIKPHERNIKQCGNTDIKVSAHRNTMFASSSPVVDLANKSFEEKSEVSIVGTVSPP